MFHRNELVGPGVGIPLFLFRYEKAPLTTLELDIMSLFLAHVKHFFHVRLGKNTKLVEDKRRHKAVWPDMLETLRETGWRNYSLEAKDLSSSPDAGEPKKQLQRSFASLRMTACLSFDF